MLSRIHDGFVSFFFIDWFNAYFKTFFCHNCRKFRGKYIQVVPLGTAHVEFPDSGNKYSWRKVTTTVHNIIVGKLWVDHHGDMEIVGEQSSKGYKCHLKFLPYSYFTRDSQRRFVCSAHIHVWNFVLKFCCFIIQSQRNRHWSTKAGQLGVEWNMGWQNGNGTCDFHRRICGKSNLPGKTNIKAFINWHLNWTFVLILFMSRLETIKRFGNENCHHPIVINIITLPSSHVNWTKKSRMLRQLTRECDPIND